MQHARKGLLLCEHAGRPSADGCLRPLSGGAKAPIPRLMNYVSRLEHGLENPTVAVLEGLAMATKTPIIELFAPPVRGRPLRGGRKPAKKMLFVNGPELAQHILDAA